MGPWGPTVSGCLLLASSQSGPLEPRNRPGASLGLPRPQSREERTSVCRSGPGPAQTQGRGCRARCWLWAVLTLGTQGPWLRPDLPTPGLTQAAVPARPRAGLASGRGTDAASPLQIRRAGPPRRRRKRRRKRAERYLSPPGALGRPRSPSRPDTAVCPCRRKTRRRRRGASIRRAGNGRTTRAGTSGGGGPGARRGRPWTSWRLFWAAGRLAAPSGAAATTKRSRPRPADHGGLCAGG